MVMQNVFGGTKRLSWYFLKWRVGFPNSEKTHIWEGEDESGTFPPTLNFAATARYRVLIVTP